MLRPIALAALVLATFGCMSTGKSGSPTAGLPGDDVQDPDPDDDGGGDAAKFCNPTGKTGDALEACYRQNEEIYRVFDEEAKSREPWFSFPSGSWLDSTEIDAASVIPVTSESDAVARLAQTPFVELSAADAEKLTGKKVELAGGKKPYLVRALLYYRETGSFTVFRKDQAILVQHDSIGRDMPKETRSALVVLLDFKPEQVYVDCAVAE